VRELRGVDGVEELWKFTMLTRDVGPYLADRYSERDDSAQELAKQSSRGGSSSANEQSVPRHFIHQSNLHPSTELDDAVVRQAQEVCDASRIAGHERE
jgi:hypothetical protein